MVYLKNAKPKNNEIPVLSGLIVVAVRHKLFQMKVSAKMAVFGEKWLSVTGDSNCQLD
jgi:hypothetical protein